MTSPIELLTDEGVIPLETVLAWMESPDLRVRAETFVLTEKAWNRIEPVPTAEQQCSFMAQYLLECLAKNVLEDDYIHSGFEAAWGLAAWIKHLVKLPEGETYIPSLVNALEEAYLRGDANLQNRIHVGVVEHALEAPAVRPYFAHWGTGASALTEVHAQALEWADAHPTDT